MPDGRLLVAEQDGALRVVLNGQLLSTPAISLAVNSTGERGLLGIAIDPQFSGNNGFIYLYYTSNSGNEHRVSRFMIDGNIIRPGSEVVLLTIPDSPESSNHNGGALRFGPDGKLYIAKGDDGVGGNAQSLNNLHGKILRINPDGSIPNDNPFYDSVADVNRAIWAYGLRNPFTFDIQPVTSRMMINDVGAGSFEEVNNGMAGHNYGWPETEGTFDPEQFMEFTPPVYSYPHTSGTDGGFAVTGAVFYPASGGTFPADYAGDYFFADLTNNWIRRIDPASNQVSLFASNIPAGTVDLDIAADGSLIVLSHNGRITRFAAAPAPTPPVITQPPVSATIDRTQGVTFFAVATGTTPFNYQWQRDGADIPGATRSTYTLSNTQLSDNGATFRVMVSNIAGSVFSTSATLTVNDSLPPNPTPTLIGNEEYGIGPELGGPNVAALFNADGTIRFSLNPYETGFSGGIRTAAADFNADGTAELVVASGPGRSGNARIYDGVSQKVLFEINPFGDEFVRGINVSAGDLDGDGRAELVVTAERGGGARVRIFTAPESGFTQRSDFFALIGGDGVADTSFRGGARSAIGDINGDGVGDLIFAAGAGGGPRIAIFNGVSLTLGGGNKLRGDFFAFEPGLRDGAYVSAGDFDGDGFAELAAAAGPGGGPRSTIFLGSALNSNQLVRLQDFFVGNVNNRAGLRLAVKDLDGDHIADLLAGGGDGLVYAYHGSTLIANSNPLPDDEYQALNGFNGSLFVG